MSYTDAEKAAYWKKKALEGSSAKKRAYKRKSTATTTRRKKAPAKKYTRYNSKPTAYTNPAPGLLSAIGTAGGSLIHPIAGFLGGKLGHLISQATGFGDYTVESNSILKGGMTPPQVVNAIDKGGYIVRHREYIGNIQATVDFTVQSFLIQPGLSNTFPWLSQIANSYDQYKLRGVIFEFKTTSSDALLSASTSTALGSVMMSTDYDIADDPPTNSMQMLNAEYACSDKPSCTFMHPIECKKSLSAQYMLYTRGTAVPANFDQRLYDFARFNIATEGMQASGGNIGQLWVTYEIEFYKQQLHYVGLADHFQLTTPSQTFPLGTVAGTAIENGSTLGGSIVPAVGYFFPPILSQGKYLWNYSVLGQGITGPIHTPTVQYSGGATGLQYYVNDTLYYVDAPEPGQTGGNTLMMQGTVQLIGQNGVILFLVDGVFPAATTVGDFWVVRIPDSISS